jgi:hypothetical protein
MTGGSARVALSQRVADATVIVRGTVISAEGQNKTEYRDGKSVPKGIYTTVKLRITDRIKGDVADSVLTFELLGGRVGTREMRINGGPAFPHEVGDEAIVLLKAQLDESVWIAREVSLGLAPIPGGVIRFWNGVVQQRDSFIPSGTYTQYVKALASGQDISLDSFMLALPKPAPSPPRVGAHGTVTADQVWHIDKSKRGNSGSGTLPTDSTGSTMTPTVGPGGQVPPEKIPEWLKKAEKPKKADTAWVDPARIDTGQFIPPKPAGPVRQLPPEKVPSAWLDKANKPVKVDTGTVDTDGGRHP